MKTSPYLAHRKATILVVLTLVAVLGSWLWLTEEAWHQGRHPVSKGVGSLVGVAGYTLFSFALFLSARWRKLEDWFGGLDRIYHLHHQLGLWGFFLLLLHPLILAFRWLPNRWDNFFLFAFPLHNRTSVNLGSIAFWLMVVIILITIFKWLPYDKWKWTHKCLSLVFILASLHFLLSTRRFDHSFAALIPLLLPMALGLFGITVKQLLLFGHPKYLVTKIDKINDSVMKITLKAEKGALSSTPGQYGFFSFRKGRSREQHPFTICEQHGDTLSILAKKRGDFTRALYENLQEGTAVFIEGPYGRFDYRQGLANQIWIAGGIGIAPFLAWYQSAKTWPGKIDLFYCFHRKSDALLVNHLPKYEQLSLHLFCSEEQQHLTLKQIQDVVPKLAEHSVFMCGPKRLTHPFRKSLQKCGVKEEQIHFEDFEFI